MENYPKSKVDPCFKTFQYLPENYSLPDRFTFPFYYQADPLCVLAANEVQNYLQNQQEWEHDFGLKQINDDSLGKMFGVLLVQNRVGILGYLAAFSGKMAGETEIQGFVPPVFNRLEEGGFYKDEEDEINLLNRKIESLESGIKLNDLVELLKIEQGKADFELCDLKERIKISKNQRKNARLEAQGRLQGVELDGFMEILRKESLKQNYTLKDRTRFWKEKLNQLQKRLELLQDELKVIKQLRKNKSAALQQKLFESYYFLNLKGEKKSLFSIFEHTNQLNPSSGAGECAAPKLLQYAFLKGYKPLAMAEFWWGLSPSSEIRKHGHFYPACRGKCEPILAHMLDGMEVDENPMLENPAAGKELELVFEDQYLLAINKPEEFLAVPGKTILDSVATRMKQKYPDADGPLVVHRLDMSTSGIMLIAKSAAVYKNLQAQFINRSVQKRYIALLEGVVHEDSGTIDLPLRVDLDNRPRQLVCYTYGKQAKTSWKVIERKDGQTRIHFFPITGRTHQLRVHAAHHLGLNAPIVGDDLYGNKGKRLHLHAASITFLHPVSGKRMTLSCEAGF